MPDADPKHALDHIVVIMFENRSFDNLLGYLYQRVRSLRSKGSREEASPTRYRWT